MTGRPYLTYFGVLFVVIIDGNYFLGSLLILLGVALLLKEIFKWDIPIFKIAISIFLIYWGLTLLFNINTSFEKTSDRKNLHVKVDFQYPKNDSEE
jgi:hypothetical protein